MPKEKKKTADQHYVPRFYLRNFSKIINPETKKPKYLIGFYQFASDGKEEISKAEVPIESICYKNFFYGEDEVTEKALSIKEVEWAKAIKAVIDKHDAPQMHVAADIVKTLKEFAVYQYMRTPSTINYMATATSQILQRMVLTEHPEFKDIEKETGLLKATADKKAEEAATPEGFVEMAAQLIQEIDDLGLSVVRFTTKSKLIISDAPVLILNAYIQNSMGLGNIGILILFPITDSLLVIISDSKMYSLSEFIECSNEDDVTALNSYQYVNAEDRVLSVDVNRLEKMRTDTALNEGRQKFKDKKKVDTTKRNSNGGMIFALHCCALNFEYPLSFIRLPRQIRKISPDYRDALPREYSIKWRERLLRESYGLRGIQDARLSAGKLQRHRDEYKKLLKFMDTYWNTPKEDMTITPRHMQELQSTGNVYVPINNDFD